MMRIEEAIDSVFYSGAPSGGFTISSAMKTIRNDNFPTIDSVKGWDLEVDLESCDSPKELGCFFG